MNFHAFAKSLRRRFQQRLSFLVRWGVCGAGIIFLLLLLLQFTRVPYRCYRWFATAPGLTKSIAVPTHILLMGGSGIPGKSGLMRTYYAAEAAARYPAATVWVAMPLDAAESPMSAAYADELTLRGVAADRIRLLSGGRNTREQALRLTEQLAAVSNAHILVVTSPEHIRRSVRSIQRAAADAGQTLDLSIHPTWSLSIEEDSLPWRSGELASPGDSGEAATASSAIATPPAMEVGQSVFLRYGFWNNAHYSQEAAREGTALLYYYLNGWL